MLKNMLRKTVTDEGKDWDRLLPYVLFAYREVPQSTGFSPFELLYGHAVRGLLDVLRGSWEGEKQSDESVVSYILSVQEKLAKMSKLVGENAARAKAQQKKWYDQNARSREFHPGEQVLVLLPTSTSKLLAQWQGPYPIVRRIGAVNYKVDKVGRRRRHCIFHVNMLRKWYVPTATSYLSEEVGDGADDDVVLWREDYPDDDKTPIVNDRLSPTQKRELQEVLEEFDDTLQNTPGRTTLAEHRIDVDPTHPIRLPPYHLP